MYSARTPRLSAFFFRFPPSLALLHRPSYRRSADRLAPPLLRCCTNRSISTLPTPSTWTRPCLWRHRCWSSVTSGPVCGRRDARPRCWTWTTTNRTGCCWSPPIRTTSACSSGRPYESCRKPGTCTCTSCACPSVIYVGGSTPTTPTVTVDGHHGVSGDFDGKGPVRKNELYDSCSILGVEEGNITVCK